MNPQKQELVMMAMERARNNYREVVSVLIPNELWNTAVNRLYYSCFHAITALLAYDEIYPKSHSGTNQLFALHYIKTGIIDKEIGVHYSDLFQMRQTADYEYDTDFTKEDVMVLIEPSAILIQKIDQVLQKE